MITVDISNIWGAVSLPDLLSLEKDVSEAHAALADGTGAGAEFLGWKKLPTDTPSGEILRLIAAAEKIRRESDILVIVGIGGSVTGAKAAIALSQGMSRNLDKGKGDPVILYAGDNLSTRQFHELSSLMAGKDVSLAFISKSGTTTEPAIATRTLRWMLERKYGTDAARSRIYVVTDPGSSALRTAAEREGWECFAIPRDVGGRFSVLSPAGLLPMAVAGMDIMEVLRGAKEAQECYDLRSFENPVWQYAAVRNLLYRHGKTVELLGGFEPGFRAFGQWWQHLFAGSEGKNGKGLFPVPMELTADLHSLGQMIQQGERNLFETVLRFDPPEQECIIGSDVLNLDGLNYLAGKSLAFVEDAACEAAVNAHADGGVPVLTVDCGKLNDRKIGELFYFFEMACTVSAYVLGVNPFRQPGVAVYQRSLFQHLGKPGC